MTIATSTTLFSSTPASTITADPSRCFNWSATSRRVFGLATSVRVALPAGHYRGRVLDLESVTAAAAAPEEFRASAPLSLDAAAAGAVELTLGPWAIVTLEEETG